MTKNLNAYFVYDLGYWLRNPLQNFVLKIYLFGAANSNKSKYIYGGYGIPLDRTGWLSFGNDIARSFVTLGVEYSSSSHTDNYKNKLLVLGEVSGDDINDTVGTAEEKFSITFVKAKKKIARGDSSHLFDNGKNNSLV